MIAALVKVFSFEISDKVHTSDTRFFQYDGAGTLWPKQASVDFKVTKYPVHMYLLMMLK
jgi:hypothetical protein